LIINEKDKENNVIIYLLGVRISNKRMEIITNDYKEKEKKLKRHI